MSKLELDDQILNHPKFIRAVKLGGAEAVFLWLGIRAYCGQNLTDGFIPTDMLDEVRGPTSAKKRAAALQVLVEVRLLDPCDGGFRMHDFLDWSRSKSQVLADRARARERQAQSRGMSRRDSGRDTGESHAPSNPDPSGCVTKASGSSSASDLPLPSDPDPPQGARARDSFGDSFASPYPESGIEGAETLRKLCESRGLDLSDQVAKHRLWALSNNRVCLRWLPDLELWIRNSKPPKGAKPQGEVDHERQARNERLHAQALRGEWGKRWQESAQAGTLDVDALRVAVDTGKAQRRPASENVSAGRLGALVAQVGKVMP